MTELNDCIQNLSTKSVVDIKLESSSNSDESNSNQALLLLINSNKFEQEKMGEIKEEGDEEMHIDDNERAPQCIDQMKSEITECEVNVAKIEKLAANQNHKLVTTEISSLKTDDVENVKEVSLVLDGLLTNVQSNLSNDVDSEVKHLCDDLLIKVSEEDEEVSKKSSPKPKTRGGRSKSRGRGRRGRGRPTRAQKEKDPGDANDSDDENENDSKQEHEEDNESVSKTEEHIESKPATKTVGRKRKTELDKLKEDFTQELTTKRCSGRIQALQEKRQLELEEEQRRFEKEMEEKRRKKEAANASKTAAMMAVAMRCQEENDSDNNDGKRKRRRKKKKEEVSEYICASKVLLFHACDKIEISLNCLFHTNLFNYVLERGRGRIPKGFRLRGGGGGGKSTRQEKKETSSWQGKRSSQRQQSLGEYGFRGRGSSL